VSCFPRKGDFSENFHSNVLLICFTIFIVATVYLQQRFSDRLRISLVAASRSPRSLIFDAYDKGTLQDRLFDDFLMLPIVVDDDEDNTSNSQSTEFPRCY